MRTAAVLALVGVVAMITTVHAAEDPRVRQVEIEVARLQRELAAQQRRVDALERELRMAGSSARATTGLSASGAARATDSSPAWLTVANWDRVRAGMREVEVVAILGRPTSVRKDDASGLHTFFYAMELGPTSLLAGNVRFGEQGVAEVHKPELR